MIVSFDRPSYVARLLALYGRSVGLLGMFHFMVVQPNLFWGPNATPQAPDMPDLLLHGPAVALLRAELKKPKPASLPGRRRSSSGPRECIRQWPKSTRSATCAGCVVSFLKGFKQLSTLEATI